MPSDTEVFYDRLAGLAAAIGDSPKLSNWFRKLSTTPAADRPRVVQGLVTQMTAHGEDPQLIRCITLLADSRMLRAVEAALDTSE